MVIVDTSILIDHFRTKRSVNSEFKSLFLKFGLDNLGLSMITIQELYQGQSTKNQDTLNELFMVLSPLKIFDYNYQIAKLAGELVRDYPKSKGYLSFADAAIAATCVFHGFQLATLNIKDFVDVPNLNLVTY